jgi:hypothetical protein
MTNGLPIISNPFTSDYGYNRINTYHVGSQTMYFKGLTGGQTCSSIGCTPIQPIITIPNAPFITRIESGDATIVVYFTQYIYGAVNISDYQYSLNGGEFISAGTTSSPLYIYGLTNGMQYTVEIRAVNFIGQSTPSNCVSVIPYSHGWVTNIGGSGIDYGYKLATDLFGNVYTVGTFSGSAVVNSFTGISSSYIQVSSFGILNSIGEDQDAFIVKYNSSGNVLWATNIGGTLNAGNDIALDTVGNIYITGYFNNLASINSYVAVETNIVSTLSIGQLSSIGSTDAYIAKYTSSGTAVWATNIGGVSIEYGFGVATDMSGNVYTTGLFRPMNIKNGHFL